MLVEKKRTLLCGFFFHSFFEIISDIQSMQVARSLFLLGRFKGALEVYAESVKLGGQAREKNMQERIPVFSTTNSRNFLSYVKRKRVNPLSFSVCTYLNCAAGLGVAAQYGHVSSEPKGIRGSHQVLSGACRSSVFQNTRYVPKELSLIIVYIYIL